VNLSELRAITHSPVVTYNYYNTFESNELTNYVYPYPYYFQVRNLFNNKTQIYKLIEVEDCPIDDIEPRDDVIIALTHITLKNE
jgi:hypothetical protein